MSNKNKINKHMILYAKKAFETYGYNFIDMIADTTIKYKIECKNCKQITIRKLSTFQLKQQQCKNCYNLARHNNLNLDDIGKYKRYRQIVRRFTLKTIKINNLSCKKTQHIDHIRSVRDCYQDSIHPEIVANIHNLQILDARTNILKSDISDMTKDELLIKIFGRIPEKEKYEFDIIPEARKFHKIEKIICVETNEIFSTIREAARKMGLDSSALTKVVNGKLLSSGGYTFKRINNPPECSIRKRTFRKKIFCLTNEKLYSSIIEASKELGISTSMISEACGGIRHVAKGFCFRPATIEDMKLHRG